MVQSKDSFAANVLSRYRQLGEAGRSVLASERKRLREQAALSPAMGHPDFAHLSLGETGTCDAASVFIDLEQFTARTFWDPPHQVAQLAQAVLSQVASVVSDYGGFVLGLRGDGLFASFGSSASQAEVDVPFALAAGAFALDATENSLNSLLVMSGIEPVKLRVGADYGRLDFTRTGTLAASEVNVVGFSANFAAKCEKVALSWEYVVGERFAEHLSDDILEAHEKSPKRYQRNYQTKSYNFYKAAWRSALPHLGGVAEALAGRSTSVVRAHY